MSKSAIYTKNNNAQALAVGSVIDLGAIERRFEQNLDLNNNYINLRGGGYYKVDAAITVTGTTAGTVEIDLLENGVLLDTSSATLAAGDVNTIPLVSMARVYGCNGNRNLSFVLTGTAETVSGISVVVEKS